MDEITIKKADNNILKELNSIGFDCSYIQTAKNKYQGQLYKIFNLKPYEANILKQLCLSLGFDCALNRDSVTCKCKTTDCLIFATNSQYKNLIQKLKKQPFRLNFLAKKLEITLFSRLEHLKIRNYTFDWSRPYIMGILNVTPDSFSDGGKYNSVDLAFEHCLELIDSGADIVDIGGESTRPNAQNITVDEELQRVIPVIKKIRKENINIPLSIDTRNFQTAQAAINAGVDIINDVSGLSEPALLDYVSKNNIPTVIMHSNKIPADSNDCTEYDIIEEIYNSLDDKINQLLNKGMDRKNIIIDVGIGFGKSQNTNFEILKRIDEFTSLNVPLLLGISRKSFIRNEFSLTIEASDIPTALYSAILKNVNIHRVHNVKITKQFLDYSNLIFRNNV